MDDSSAVNLNDESATLEGPHLQICPPDKLLRIRPGFDLAQVIARGFTIDPLVKEGHFPLAMQEVSILCEWNSVVLGDSMHVAEMAAFVERENEGWIVADVRHLYAFAEQVPDELLQGSVLAPGSLREIQLPGRETFAIHQSKSLDPEISNLLARIQRIAPSCEDQITQELIEVEQAIRRKLTASGPEAEAPSKDPYVLRVTMNDRVREISAHMARSKFLAGTRILLTRAIG
jgi:hypothetical protein